MLPCFLPPKAPLTGQLGCFSWAPPRQEEALPSPCENACAVWRPGAPKVLGGGVAGDREGAGRHSRSSRRCRCCCCAAAPPSAESSVKQGPLAFGWRGVRRFVRAVYRCESPVLSACLAVVLRAKGARKQLLLGGTPSSPFSRGGNRRRGTRRGRGGKRGESDAARGKGKGGCPEAGAGASGSACSSRTLGEARLVSQGEGGPGGAPSHRRLRVTARIRVGTVQSAREWENTSGN